MFELSQQLTTTPIGSFGGFPKIKVALCWFIVAILGVKIRRVFIIPAKSLHMFVCLFVALGQ